MHRRQYLLSEEEPGASPGSWLFEGQAGYQVDFKSYRIGKLLGTCHYSGIPRKAGSSGRRLAEQYIFRETAIAEGIGTACWQLSFLLSFHIWSRFSLKRIITAWRHHPSHKKGRVRCHLQGVPEDFKMPGPYDSWVFLRKLRKDRI